MITPVVSLKSKRVIWSALLVLLVGSGFYLWKAITRPKRVWIEYSEYSASGDLRPEPIVLHPGQGQLTFSAYWKVVKRGKDPCVVFTSNKDRADLIVTLSVTTYTSPRLPGDILGHARLLISKSNGDLILNEDFPERRSSNAAYMAEWKALGRAWEVFCP